MSNYTAPLRDMQFILNEVAGLEEICALPGNDECSVELVESILDEAAKFATGAVSYTHLEGNSSRRRKGSFQATSRRFASNTVIP